MGRIRITVNSDPHPVSSVFPDSQSQKGHDLTHIQGNQEGGPYWLSFCPLKSLLGKGWDGGQASPEPLPMILFLPPALDVYSYDEDDMVLDPSLAEHLSHFGIDMLKMQKVRPLQLQILLPAPVRALPLRPRLK